MNAEADRKLTKIYGSTAERTNLNLSTNIFSLMQGYAEDATMQEAVQETRKRNRTRTHTHKHESYILRYL